MALQEKEASYLNIASFMEDMLLKASDFSEAEKETALWYVDEHNTSMSVAHLFEQLRYISAVPIDAFLSSKLVDSAYDSISGGHHGSCVDCRISGGRWFPSWQSSAWIFTSLLIALVASSLAIGISAVIK